MRCARHPLSPASIALALTLAVMGSGCGSSDTSDSSAAGEAAPAGAVAKSCPDPVTGAESLRVTGVDCASGRDVAAAWGNYRACFPTGEASRTSCTVGEYRCLGATSDRGVAVSCASPGRSISFLARRG
jgi:hypothetical protein